MAIINITSDSDGTLHSAALHNDKFAVVQNVINGNIEHANLKYPNSVVEWSADTYMIPYQGPTAPTGGAEAFAAGWNSADFSGPTVTWSYDTNASASNYITNSFRKTDRAYKFLSTKVWYHQQPFPSSNPTWKMFFEYSDDIDIVVGNWTTIFTFDMDTDVTPAVPYIKEFDGPADVSIAAAKYFRIRLLNGASYNEPSDGPDLPEVHVKMVMATQHVA